ncbi:MAG: crossover junction endodeoxyribonuclease RuvC [Patescibacteria group bacterium]
MIILGVDPGETLIGIGVVRKTGSGALSLVAAETIIIDARGKTPAEKLHAVEKQFENVLKRFVPAVAAVERLFFFKNAKTAFAVAQARGVMLASLARRDIPIFEFTPPQVKQAVAGYGRADKKQVQKMVRLILKLPHPITQDDAADAVAVAICAAAAESVARYCSASSL